MTPPSQARSRVDERDAVTELFHAYAADAFRFLEEEYGCRRVAGSTSGHGAREWMRWENDAVVVHLGLGSRELSCSVERRRTPLDILLRRHRFVEDTWAPVQRLAREKGSEEIEVPEPRDPDAVEAGILAYATAVRRYADAELRGDFSNFPGRRRTLARA